MVGWVEGEGVKQKGKLGGDDGRGKTEEGSVKKKSQKIKTNQALFVTEHKKRTTNAR